MLLIQCENTIYNMIGNISVRLLEIRKKNRISQCKLAKILGTTQPNISRYENGIITPGYDIIIMYMNYFQVTFDYLMCLTDDPNYAKYSNIKKIAKIN